jgi:hypothetical protein
MFLVTMPVMLGRGKRLFGDAAAPSGMKLVDHRLAGTGATISVYELGGKVPIGSFASEAPSEAELARREKLKLEDA